MEVSLKPLPSGPRPAGQHGAARPTGGGRVALLPWSGRTPRTAEPNMLRGWPSLGASCARLLRLCRPACSAAHHRAQKRKGVSNLNSIACEWTSATKTREPGIAGGRGATRPGRRPLGAAPRYSAGAGGRRALPPGQVVAVLAAALVY